LQNGGEKKPLVFKVWDFAGQEVYYNMHHFFLTSRALFTLIINLSIEPFNDDQRDRLLFWLHSIRSYSKHSPIIIIATHKDLLSQKEVVIRLGKIREWV